MKKKTAAIIAPGRGVYGATELGYLRKHHPQKNTFLGQIDAYRRDQGRIPVTELDAAQAYAAGKHASSINASSLIYTCALADNQDIDLDQYEIVAATGNSLGWYLALAVAGALDPRAAITLVDTMGALMEEKGVGGQLVYPVCDADWQPSPEREEIVRSALQKTDDAHPNSAFLSIDLCGMAVLAGTEKALFTLEKYLPQADGRFPFRLARHSAFHTPLLSHVAAEARSLLPPSLFTRPKMPLVDGRGVIWQPYDNLDDLHAYTLGTQITETYSFSKAVEVTVKEFAPDVLIALGPGGTLGPPIAQELIKHRWRGMTNKAEFIDQQGEDPYLLAMGLDHQRARVVPPTATHH